MSHARRAYLAAAVGLTLLAAACSSMENSAFDRGPDDGSAADAGSPFPGYGDSGAPSGAFPTGVIIVHAAAFPSFRLCFSNHMEMVPQPDSRVMPQANVVGVDIGSFVRIDPLDTPGTVFVIREAAARQENPADKPKTCRQLLGKVDVDAGTTTGGSLEIYDYLMATSIDEPIGREGVSVLAVTGCGTATNLEDIGASNANCAKPYDAAKGNLEARVFRLPSYPRNSGDVPLPVQLYQLSPELAALDADGGTLRVEYGALDPDAGATDSTEIPLGGLYEGGAIAHLPLDQGADLKTYGQFGFRVTTSGAFSTEQSLASVQDFSSPLDVPNSFYAAASSFALLLVGDPNHTPASPKYNPRRAVHFLAVPVVDPEPRDAGTSIEDDAGEAIADGGN